MRLKLDLSVARALGVKVDERTLLQVYEVIVNEMIVTRGFRSD